MMGGVSPETCWAIKKQWNNKFYYTVASCWFFLWDLYYDARIHEHQVIKITKSNGMGLVGHVVRETGKRRTFFLWQSCRQKANHWTRLSSVFGLVLKNILQKYIGAKCIYRLRYGITATLGLLHLADLLRTFETSLIIYSSSYRRVQLKCDGTWWRTGGEVKGKLANGVGSQYSSHYPGTWCIQHCYRWCAHLGCQ